MRHIIVSRIKFIPHKPGDHLRGSVASFRFAAQDAAPGLEYFGEPASANSSEFCQSYNSIAKLSIFSDLNEQGYAYLSETQYLHGCSEWFRSENQS